MSAVKNQCAAFKIIASDKAPAGKEVSLTVVATANINGRNYQFRGSPVVVTINAPAAEAGSGSGFGNSETRARERLVFGPGAARLDEEDMRVGGGRRDGTGSGRAARWESPDRAA